MIRKILSCAIPDAGRRWLSWHFRLFRSCFSGYVSASSVGVRHGGFWRIPSAYLSYDYGLVYSAEHKVLKELSPDIGGAPINHPCFYQRKLPATISVDQPIFLGTGHAQQVYFHWMFDIVPILHDYQSSFGDGVLCYTNTEFPFQKETLLRLGIMDRVVPASADRALYSPLVIATGCQRDFGVPTAAVSDLLRTLFLHGDTDQPPLRRIFVGRRGAGSRRLLNEDALAGKLEQLGFDSINCGRLTIAEQARLFSSASIIVGVHGAALTNIVFAKPGAVVIELMPPNYSHPCYEQLSFVRRLRFNRLVGFSDCDHGLHDFSIDVGEVVEAIICMSKGAGE